ncbi:MAG: 5-(carboxyamino)imidazole ribonucleotide synthase [Cyanobacteria bacterium REEB444]|nr:5-(carboxyamino)imidazole ribonucleotide synthase [Cyanobacteria bacterium REEB444]
MASEVPKKVGIIGGGQLAWMMGQAASTLGIKLVIQTPQVDDPAIALTHPLSTIDPVPVLAPINDGAATAQLAHRCQLITFENEFVNLTQLQQLEQSGVCFRPSLNALHPLLDKYKQRSFLDKIGLPVPRFCPLHPYHWSLIRKSRTSAELREITTAHGDFPFSLTFPLVLKTRCHGYDGQGTFIISDLSTLQTLGLQFQNTPLLLEEFVPFVQELAIIAARNLDGHIKVYPLVETQQVNQVCHRVIAPAVVDQSILQQCHRIAHTILHQLEYVGIMGIELFLTSQGNILINEIAPRTHNSGHFTLDACKTSQFEQHLRAISGLPLGGIDLTCDAAVMINLLGYEHNNEQYEVQRQAIAQLPGAFVWWYGKSQSRPGRKLGHVTVKLTTPYSLIRQTALETAMEVENLWRTH